MLSLKCEPVLGQVDERKTTSIFDSLDILWKNQAYASYAKQINGELRDIYLKNSQERHMMMRSHANRVFQNAAKFDSVDIRRIHYAMGRFEYVRLGNLEKAEKHYLAAHDFLSDKVMCDDLCWYIEYMLTTIYTRLGDYDRAFFYYNLVQDYLKRIHRTNQLSRLLSNKARTHRFNGEIDKAINGYRLGIVTAEKYQKGLSANYLGLVDLYNSLNLPDSAEETLKLFNASLEEETRTWYRSYITENLADVTLARGQTEKADSLYRLAICHWIEKNGTRYHWDVAKIYLKLATMSLDDGQSKKADRYIQQGLHCLLPKLDSIKPESPGIVDVYKENTFIDLLDTRTKILLNALQQSPGNDSLVYSN